MAGLGLLWAGFPILPLPLVFYGAGIGIESIARGTLPLAVFGEDAYPAIMGRIAMPSLVMQTASPSVGAFLIDHGGASASLAALFSLALLNVLPTTILFMPIRRRR